MRFYSASEKLSVVVFGPAVIPLDKLLIPADAAFLEVVTREDEVAYVRFKRLHAKPPIIEKWWLGTFQCCDQRYYVPTTRVREE